MHRGQCTKKTQVKPLTIGAPRSASNSPSNKPNQSTLINSKPKKTTSHFIRKRNFSVIYLKIFSKMPLLQLLLLQTSQSTQTHEFYSSFYSSPKCKNASPSEQKIFSLKIRNCCSIKNLTRNKSVALFLEVKT